MAKRRKRAHERFSAAWGEPGGPFPIFVLSGTQWNEIAALSGIPIESDDGRRKIEHVINLYRRFVVNDSARAPSAETHRQLESLKSDTLALLGQLVRLVENSDAHFALTVARQPEQKGPFGFPQTGRLDAHRRLEGVMAELQHLADWIAVASPRLESDRRGPATANVYWLAEALDVIREEFTGQKLVRSTKRTDTSREYVKTVCRIADATIGDGTIERAMKDRIKRRAVDELATNSRANSSTDSL